MNNITDLIFALATAAIPVIAAWATKKILASKESVNKAKAAIDVSSAIALAAQQAVTTAEKIGNETGLFGDDKKKAAIKYVQNALDNLHITNADLTMINGAVEQAFLHSKDQIEKAYPRTEVKTDDSTNAPASPLPADIGDKLDAIASMLKQQDTTVKGDTSKVPAPATGDPAQVPADNAAKNVQG